MPRAMGVDYHKKNLLRKMFEEEYSVEDAGLRLSIDDEVVANWYKTFEEEAKEAKKEVKKGK